MSQTAILTKLLEILEHCKGYLKHDEYFEALSLMLALAAKHPQFLKRTIALSNDWEACGVYFFRELEYLQQSEPDMPWDTGCLEGVIAPVIVVLAKTVIVDRGRIAQTAAAVRTYYATHIQKRSRTDLALQHYFQALLGDISDKAVIDSSCGLAIKTLAFTPLTLVLSESSPILSYVSHRLLIAEQSDAIFSRHDYLLDACDPSRQLTPSGGINLLSADGVFDIAIAEPPSSMVLNDNHIKTITNNFPFMVKPKAEIPSTAATSLWVQQTLRQLKDNGTAYIIVSNGWLSRGGYDAQLRETLLIGGYIDSVIALEENPLATDKRSILVLRKPATPDNGYINFMDESAAIARQLQKVAPENEDDFFYLIEESVIYTSSKKVAIKDILNSPDRQANLNPQYYLYQHHQPLPDQQSVLERLRIADTEARAAQQHLQTLIEKHQH